MTMARLPLLILIITAVLTYTSAAIVRRSAPDSGSGRLLIGAFNIKVFGVTKMSKEPVVQNLIKIISRYDILLIQEIRDKSQKAIYELRDRLEANGDVFSVSLSERLGRSISKEQYAFFYRSDKVNITQTYQYPVALDQFERPPYGVLFTSPYTVIQNFVLLGIHVDPDEAVVEINNLVQVYDKAANALGTQDIMIMGDLNADCSYVRDSEWDDILLWTDKRFEWLVGDDADTTVYTTTDCAYDRFVKGGSGWDSGIVPNSVEVYNFEDALGLTNDDAKLVSDHYPIELTLEAKGSTLTSTIMFTVSQTLQWADLSTVTSAPRDNDVISGYQISEYSKDGTTALVILNSGDVSDPIASLDSLASDHPDLIDSDLMALVRKYFNDGTLNCNNSVSEMYRCVIMYKMAGNGVSCDVTVSKYL